MASAQQVIRAISPKASPAFIAGSARAGEIMAQYGIVQPIAQAQLLAHMAVETMGFTAFVENMNYSAQRLVGVWPNRFPSISAATPYANNPKALAIKVYGGRMGNRANTSDGYDYRGGGGLHHTGRDEYARVERRTGLPALSVPARIRDPAAAEAIWHAACSYVVDRKALAAFNAGAIEDGTRKVNGGVNGLSDRKIMFVRAQNAMAGRTIDTSKARTSDEKVDSDRKNVGRATVGAGTAAPTTGGAAKTGGAEWGTAFLIGAVVLVIGGVIVFALTRKLRASNARLEAQRMAAIDTRIAAAEADAVAVGGTP